MDNNMRLGSISTFYLSHDHALIKYDMNLNLTDEKYTISSKYLSLTIQFIVNKRV